jgi:hypothetical protein
MTTWLVSGMFGLRFNRKRRFWTFVDVDEKTDADGSAMAAAITRVAGSPLCYVSAEALLPGAIPFDCRQVLFKSKKELYARVPDLDEAFAEFEFDDEEGEA